MDFLQVLQSFFMLALIIIAYYVILIKCKSKANWVRLQKILLAVVVIIGLPLYYYAYSSDVAEGYKDMNEMTKLILSAIYTAKVLTLLPDTKIVGSGLLKTELIFSALFFVLYATSLLLLIMVAMTQFGRRTNSYLRFYLNGQKDKYLFLGENSATITLAEDLSKNNNRLILFIGNLRADKKDFTFYDKVEAFGGVYIETNTSVSKFSKYLFKNPLHLFFMSDNEDENLADTLKIVEQLKILPDNEKKNIHIHLRLESENIHQLFEQQITKLGSWLQYTIFRDSELIATMMVKEHNPVDLVKPDIQKAVATTNFEVMIVGFGSNGNAALRKLIECGQFVGSKFRAIVIDKDISSKMGSFYAQYPGLYENKEVYKIDPIETEVGSEHFFGIIEKECTTIKQIVIALGEDNLNIRTATDVNNKLMCLGHSAIKTIAIVRDKKYYTALPIFNQIYFTGRNDKLFTEDIIVNEKLIIQAKQLHSFYEKKKKEKAEKDGKEYKTVEWEKLIYIKKVSNQTVAEHVIAKLSLIGLTPEQLKTNFSSKEKWVEYIKSYPDIYKNLAKGEHLRWNASYFVRGWRKWNLGDITGGENQNAALRLHACLVAWDELENVEKRFNAPYREYDHNIIDEIYYNIVVDGVLDEK